MPSLSFDPVAHIYDATRGYPFEVAQRIAQAIETTTSATPATTFLEVGIGTGRIAFPLASLGHTYSGVDISGKMVEQLETKLAEDGWQEYQQPNDDNHSLQCFQDLLLITRIRSTFCRIYHTT